MHFVCNECNVVQVSAPYITLIFLVAFTRLDLSAVCAVGDIVQLLGSKVELYKHQPTA